MIYKPNQYPSKVLEELNNMTQLAIEIANRWALGWPKSVKNLIQSGEFLDVVYAEEKRERDALCNPNLSHLARHEIVELYGLSVAPPEASTPWGPYCGIGDEDEAENTDGASQMESSVYGLPGEKKHGLVSFEVSDPYEHDGKLMRSILATHSDGFVCLRIEDVETSK